MMCRMDIYTFHSSVLDTDEQPMSFLLQSSTALVYPCSQQANSEDPGRVAVRKNERTEMRRKWQYNRE